VQAREEVPQAATPRGLAVISGSTQLQSEKHVKSLLGMLGTGKFPVQVVDSVKRGDHNNRETDLGKAPSATSGGENPK